jgi:hypothetical protein
VVGGFDVSLGGGGWIMDELGVTTSEVGAGLGNLSGSPFPLPLPLPSPGRSSSSSSSSPSSSETVLPSSALTFIGDDINRAEILRRDRRLVACILGNCEHFRFHLGVARGLVGWAAPLKANGQGLEIDFRREASRQLTTRFAGQFCSAS